MITFPGEAPAAASLPTENPPGPDVDPPGAGLTRPFDAPVTTATYTVPGTIAHTGAANAAADLATFIATVPDGSIIDFAIAGAVYRLDAGILLSARNNLFLQGHGTTTLRMNGTDAETFSTFLLRASSHIAIEDFIVEGAYTTARGVGTFPVNSGEASHCLGLSGYFDGGPSSYVEMSGIVGDHFYGDFAYLEGSNGGAFPPAHHVWIHDNDFDYCGRNGLSLINVTDVWFERNTTNHVAYHAVDFEPNFTAEEAQRVYIRDNAFGSYAHRATLIGFFISLFSPNHPTWSQISVTGNTVAGIAANGVNGQPRGLNSSFLGQSSDHLSFVTFQGNSCPLTVAGSAVLYFNYCDTVVCTGNTQALSSGTLVQADNSTSTILSPNP